MTPDEADLKIKLLKGPFAKVVDRGSDTEAPGKALPQYYVGWSPCFGNGNTWEEAFADLRRNDDHSLMQPRWRLPRSVHSCAHCRAPKHVLKRRFAAGR